MDMVFKKPRLNVSTAQETGVSCSSYQALRAPPSQSDVDGFKGALSAYPMLLFTSGNLLKNQSRVTGLLTFHSSEK